MLDLFAGIGGFSLAGHWMGWTTTAFVERDPICHQVLRKNFGQDIVIYDDVRTFDGTKYLGTVDIVCGGFPCQDISSAGKGVGINGAKSGLWYEMLRIIRGARPAFCLIENAPALRTRGADNVLDGLADAGYSARCFVVGAVNAGAPHRRQRVWIVAYSEDNGAGWRKSLAGSGEGSGNVANPRQPADRRQGQARDNFGRGGALLADPDRQGMEGQWEISGGDFPEHTDYLNAGWWKSEPDVDRVANGVPNRTHRIKALGNSIVPAVAYPFALWIKSQLEANP